MWPRIGIQPKKPTRTILKTRNKISRCSPPSDDSTGEFASLHTLKRASQRSIIPAVERFQRQHPHRHPERWKKKNKQTKKRRKRRRKGRESQATPKWIAIDGAEHRLNTIEINNEEGNILVSKRGRRCFSLSFLLSFFLAPRQMIFLTVKAKPIKRPARTRTIGRAGIVPAGIVPDYDDPERETEREREREREREKNSRFDDYHYISVDVCL